MGNSWFKIVKKPEGRGPAARQAARRLVRGTGHQASSLSSASGHACLQAKTTDCSKEKGGCWHEKTAPALEVVRRWCGVTDGLLQERMAAATIPAASDSPLPSL
jgi:hypothetical protein